MGPVGRALEGHADPCRACSLDVIIKIFTIGETTIHEQQVLDLQGLASLVKASSRAHFQSGLQGGGCKPSPPLEDLWEYLCFLGFHWVPPVSEMFPSQKCPQTALRQNLAWGSRSCILERWAMPLIQCAYTSPHAVTCENASYSILVGY